MFSFPFGKINGFPENSIVILPNGNNYETSCSCLAYIPDREQSSWTPKSASPLNEAVIVQLKDLGYGETTGSVAFSSTKLGRIPQNRTASSLRMFWL